MRFRRDKTSSLEWTTWVGRVRDDLLQAGVPIEVITDEHRWKYFCGHGYDAASGWKPELASTKEQQLLRAFMLREYGPDGVRMCLGSLTDEL